MSVFVVPQTDWARFCQEFSTDHSGELITIEALSGNEFDPGVERNIIARDCPLHSLRMEHARTEDLLLFLGREQDAGPEFVVVPRQIRLEQPDADEPGRLRIETDDGQVILLHLPVPVMPGILNGA